MLSFDAVAVLRQEAHRMAEVPEACSGNPVPQCPGWDVADLLAHTGWVHRWMTHLLSLPEGERTSRERARAAGLPSVGATQRPEGDLRAWLRASAGGLADALEATPPSKHMVTRFGEHQPSLIARRAAHETAVHRWDAERATGSPRDDFDPDLAADGVDEVLELWVPARFDHAGFGGRGETVELVPVDGGDPWQIVVGATATTWRRGPRTDAPTVSARGPVAELYLFVWNRMPADRFDVTGDVDALERWQRCAVV